MNVTQIKAAVDAGKSVHWANEGYRVHRDALGQYLITYVPTGNTIGLTDRSGRRLNGADADSFTSPSARGTDGATGREVRGPPSEGHPDAGTG